MSLLAQIGLDVISGAFVLGIFAVIILAVTVIKGKY